MNNDDKVNYDGNEHVASGINERNDRWSKVEEEEEVESKMIPRQYSSTVQYRIVTYRIVTYRIVPYYCTVGESSYSLLLPLPLPYSIYHFFHLFLR